jgi:hypothetical protein
VASYCEVMSTPEPADRLAWLQELIFPDLHRGIDGASRTATVGWGTATHKSTTKLRRCCTNTSTDVALPRPNRRTAVEHAVCLVWLADQGDTSWTSSARN